MTTGDPNNNDRPASCSLLDSYSFGNSDTDTSEEINLNDADYTDEEDFGEHVTIPITINLPQAEMHAWGE